MSYLAKNDYTLHISIDHLDRVLEQAANTSGKAEDVILDESELYAAAQITALLKNQYEIEEELDKLSTETDRNRLIMKCMIDISLYHLFYTVNPVDVPEARRILYNECLDMLKAYRNNEIDMGLNVVDADEDGQPDAQRFEFGSNRKFTSKPYSDYNLLNDNGII